MERKSGNSGSGRRGGQSSGKFPAESDHQSVAVVVREGNCSDDKRKLFSSAAGSDRNVSNNPAKDLPRRQKATSKETEDKYLQDSYKEAFQKHVDNLTNVISQHRNKESQQQRKEEEEEGEEEESAEFQSREGERSRVKTGRRSKVELLAPLTRLEIKSDAGINQVVNFVRDHDEGEVRERRMNAERKNASVETGLIDEENIFEYLAEPNPTITFNHVCTETETDGIGLHRILSSSRSPSPMLEVPDAKRREKMATRPPL